MKDKDPLRELMRTRLPDNGAWNPHWVRMTRIMARWHRVYPGWTVAHIAENVGIHEADVRRGLAEARANELVNDEERQDLTPAEDQAMPPRSEAQRKLFRAAAASPEVRKRTGITKKVAAEFNKTDPGGKLPRKALKGKRK